MTSNIDDIYNRFIQVARDTVGGSLASTKKLATTVPAVYRQVDRNPTARYPFMTVNVTQIPVLTDPALYEYFTSTGEISTTSQYTFMVDYTVYGTTDSTVSAQQIAWDLRSKLTTKSGLNALNEDGLGEAVDFSTINQNTFRRDNSVGEACSFIVFFTVEREELDTEYELLEVQADLKTRYSPSEDDVLTTSITINKSGD